MKTLYMKIHSYEEQSKSLIVSFASDATKSQDPNNYAPLAFQPVNMWPDVSDPAEIKKRIAVAGIGQAERQAREENFVEDAEKIAQYKNMVGQQDSFLIDDLIPPPPPSDPEIPIQTV